MKIAIEAQRIFRKKKHGMDIVALELIRHLQVIDRENEYYILVKPDEDNNVLTPSTNFKIIEIPRAPYPVWEQISLPKVLKEIQPDILHCTSNTAPVSSLIPLILTLHDIIFMGKIDFSKGTWYQRMGNVYRRYIVPKVLPQCKKIITVSKYEQERITEFFALAPGKVEAVYNSCNPSFHNIKDRKKLDQYRNKYKLPQKFLLFLGNTDPKKNFLNLLKALDLLYKEKKMELPLVLPDVEKKFLRKMLSDNGISDLESAIYLTGYIPNHELVYIYNLASVFLYPSFYESFGIPIIEAMACGVPVITSKTAAMPEVAGEAAILVEPGNPAQIADSIFNIMNDPILYTELSQAGQDRALNFNWMNTAKEVLSLYEKTYNQLNSKSRTLQC